MEWWFAITQRTIVGKKHTHTLRTIFNLDLFDEQMRAQNHPELISLLPVYDRLHPTNTQQTGCHGFFPIMITETVTARSLFGCIGAPFEMRVMSRVNPVIIDYLNERERERQ